MNETAEKPNAFTLTDADQKVVRWIASEVAEQLGEKISTANRQAMAQAIEMHVATCEAGKVLFGSRRFIAGVLAAMFALGAGGSMFGEFLTKLLTGP
jgi:hypothetical protein